MSEKRSGVSGGVVLIMAVVGLFLCGATTTAGFFIGRLTAPVMAEAAGVTVVAAVTREVVTVVVTPAPTAPSVAEPTATSLPQPPVPAPLPTVAPQPTTEPAGPPEAFSPEDLAVLWEVWDQLERDYDGDLPDGAELGDDIISYAVSAIGDPFTRYVSPDIAARGRESREGGFEGIGAFVAEDEEGRFVITRPMDGQPADLAGLRAGDVVVAVDGVPIAGMTIDETVTLVRGPQGTLVTLTVEREGEQALLDITIVRDYIELPILEAELLPNGIAYVRLYTFAQVNVAEQFISTVNELLAQEPRGLIIDLRDNGGGLLDQTVQIGDYLLPEGILLQERNRQGLDVLYQTYSGEPGEFVPLVVLVNEGSASASELMAGAIQDRDRGTIIGATTFGKGSVQLLYTISNGAELRVTIARWFTPDNHSVDGVGITPDILIETPLDLGGPDDPQLNRAIEYLLTGR